MTGTPLPGEFEIIARFLAPLSEREPGAFGLTDDAAVLAIPEGRELVVTTDTLVAGVHFPVETTPYAIAVRALAVNLSDLAAMGAEPRAYFLSLGLPRGLGGGIDEAWLGAFASGLADMQSRHRIALAGGDTVAVPGPLVLTITALGTVVAGQAIRRAGARPGDLVCVSGTIGDAALGLRALKGGLSGLAREMRLFLIDRFETPQPRVALGAALSGLATAALDISDGLAADLGHLCAQSRVSATVRIDDIALSDAARAALRGEHGLLGPCVLGGGDDYELVFTVPAGKGDQAREAGTRAGTPVSVIGVVEAGSGAVRFVDGDGNEVVPLHAGYRHF